MRSFLLVVVFSAVAGVGFVHAQSQSVDMVVLVDSSASMFPYWTDTTHYLVRNILSQVLQRGDTFHLLSFAAHPQLDVSKRIESHKDIQYILARYLLLQPLGRYTDLVAAIRYVYRYVNDLAAASTKEIFILTDGIDDPPPGSEYPIVYGPKGPEAGHLRRIVDDTVQAMRSQGWQVHIIQYPRAGSSPPPRVPQPGVELLGPTEVRTVRPGASPEVTPEIPSAAAARKPSANATTPTGSQPQTTAVAPPPKQVEAPPSQPAPQKQVQPAARPTGAAPIAAATAPAQTPSPPAPAARATETAVPKTAHGGEAPSPGPSATTSSSGVNASRGTASAGAAPSAVAQGTIQGAQAGRPSQPLTAAPTAAPEGSTTSTSSQAATASSTPSAASGARAGAAGATAATPTTAVTPTASAKSPAGSAAGAGSGSTTTQAAGASLARKHGVTGRQGIGGYLLFVLFGIVFIAVVVLIIILIRRLIENLRATPIVPITAKNRLGGANGSIFAIEFRVTGQNPNIGGRNIRPMGPGARRTIGGRGSAFLIYLYPCPPNIGEVVFDNGSYTFLPTKSEHFPGSSGKLSDCLGKPIRVVPDGVHEVMIWFRRYVSPLDEVNRIMHLVDKPGTPTSPST